MPVEVARVGPALVSGVNGESKIVVSNLVSCAPNISCHMCHSLTLKQPRDDDSSEASENLRLAMTYHGGVFLNDQIQ